MSCPGVAMRTNDATTNNHQVASIIENFPAAMRRSVRFAGDSGGQTLVLQQARAGWLYERLDGHWGVCFGGESQA
jgi:hypothetical protein